MGLITALLSPVIGHSFTFMTPAAFVRRPGRWIRELARKPEDETGEVFSVAPNFAFEHAALRGLPKDGEPPLDLSNVKAILNGSEPVSPASMRKFYDAFGPYGLQETAIKPSYGLAEATLFVSTTPMDEAPTIIHVDRDELNNQTLRRGARRCAERRRAGFRRHDRCRRVGGHRRPRHRQRAAGRADRRDLAARQEPGHRLLEQGRGDHTRPSRTSSSRASASRTPRAPPTTGLWVRTGDYGTYHNDHLYITGPHQGPGHRRRPQPLPAGSRVLGAGSQPGLAHRLRGRVLGAGQPAARRWCSTTRTPA